MFTISVTLCEIITINLTKCSRLESSTFKKQATVMSYNDVKYVVEWLCVQCMRRWKHGTYLQQRTGIMGIMITKDLKCSKQCLNANKILRMIKRTFTCKSEEIIMQLYKSLVRPRLEYRPCVPTWGRTLTYWRRCREEQHG